MRKIMERYQCFGNAKYIKAEESAAAFSGKPENLEK
jgi:hypothetical protein